MRFIIGRFLLRTGLYRLVLPYTRSSIPSGWLLRRLGFAYLLNPLPWPGPATREIRSRTHKLIMRLELNESVDDRIVYFRGRFYELHTEIVMKHLLRPGDVMLDVGANHGFLTLHGSAHVGERGHVHSFEPNTHCVARIREQLHINGLRNVTVYQIGLAEKAGQMELCVPEGLPGSATLAHLPDPTTPTSRKIIRLPVEVARGDDVLTNCNAKCRLIKIDVEDFEVKALTGLQETIRQSRPFIITEAIPEWLSRAGDSLDALFDLMDGMAYRCYKITTTRQLWRRRLLVQPTNVSDIGTGSDVLWVPKETCLPPNLVAESIGRQN